MGDTTTPDEPSATESPASILGGITYSAARMAQHAGSDEVFASRLVLLRTVAKALADGDDVRIDIKKPRERKPKRVDEHAAKGGW